MKAGRTVAGLVLGALLGGLLGSGWQLMNTPDVPPAPAPVVLHEDSPGWDCATSGNGLCGPGPKGTRR